MAATLQLVLRKRANKNGKFPIYLRIIKNRKVSYVSTDHSIEANQWDYEKAKVKPSHPNSARLNSQLKKLESEYSDRILDIEKENLAIGMKGIKRKITGQDVSNFTVVAKELQAKYKMESKISSHDKVASIIKKFTEYMHSENFSFEDIDINLLNKYQAYLIEVKKNKPSSINRDMKFIKTAFRYAHKMGYLSIHTDPFINFTYLKANTERGFLEPNEISLIEQLDCSKTPYVDKAKDTILFQYFAGGLRISDVLLLRWENIIDSRIHLTIKKTGKQTSHKLTPKALTILEKYKNSGNNFVFGYLENGFDLLDPVLVDRVLSGKTALVNKALKIIGKNSGLKKRLSTHLLRHSFATNALQQGISLDSLQSILNHSNVRETQIYAKILNSKVDAEIDKLAL